MPAQPQKKSIQKPQQKTPPATNQTAAQAFQKRNAKQQTIFDQYGYHIVIGGLVALIALAIGNQLVSKDRHLEVSSVVDDEYIQYHNNHMYGFKLGANDYFEDWMLQEAKNYLRTELTKQPSIPGCQSSDGTGIIEQEYNFRLAYSNCARPIQSQGKCASSYALTAASTISDRVCVQTKELEIEGFSAQPIISCDVGTTNQCLGGSVSGSFDFAKKVGLPKSSVLQYTGNTQVNCKVFEQAPKNKILGYCASQNEESIKREIQMYGPVITTLNVNTDFLVYKSGVYEVLPGVQSLRSSQAIKIIGWGNDEETNRDYWLIENTWGATWGENGLARISTASVKDLFIDFTLAPITQAS